MSKNKELEQQIQRLRDKMKLLCDEYLKIKKQLMGKQGRILELQKENQDLKHAIRLNKLQESPKTEQFEHSIKQNLQTNKQRLACLREKIRQKNVTPPKTENFISSKQFIKQNNFYKHNMTSVHTSDIPLQREREPDFLQFSRGQGEKQKELDQAESMILKEIWQERDRQINRMNELFNDLNQRLTEIQQ